MLTAPSFFVERPKPLAFAVIRFRRGGHWSGSGHDGRKCRDRFRAELRQKIEQEWQQQEQQERDQAHAYVGTEICRYCDHFEVTCTLAHIPVGCFLSVITSCTPM